MLAEIKREIEKKVRAEDFPENYKRVVDSIGVDGALKLTKVSGGINQYIPVYDCITTAARDRLIREEFNGDYQELAIKYGISENWIRSIIDQGRRQMAKAEYQKNQVSLEL